MMLKDQKLEPVGCGMGSTKSTVFAFSADSRTLDEVVKKAKEIAAISLSNNNKMVVAMLGAADAESMQAAKSAFASMQGIRFITLAGAREKGFSADCLSSANVGTVVNLDGVRGGRNVLLLPANGAKCLRALRMATETAFEDKLDAMTLNNIPDDDDQDGGDAEAISVALDQLGWEGDVITTIRSSFSVCSLLHARTWRMATSKPGNDLAMRVPHVSRSFALANGNPLCLGCAIASGCGSTLARVRLPPIIPNRQETLAQLQEDTEMTLALLLDKRPGLKVEKMAGVVGPVVLAGRRGDEPMRLTQWNFDDGEVAILLLADNYVSYIFSDHLIGADHNSAYIMSNSTLRLPRAARVACTTAVDCDDLDEAKGPRVWIMTNDALNKGINTTRYDIFEAQTTIADELTGINCHFSIATLAGRPIPVLDTDD